MRTSTVRRILAVVIALCSGVTSTVVTSGSRGCGGIRRAGQAGRDDSGGAAAANRGRSAPLAEKHRQDRARLAKETGKPVELISDYVRAQMLPVPASLGVSPFYKKYVDAQGIPVISSDKVPDAALLVARDIVNTHAGDAAGPAQGDDCAQVADRCHRRSRDDDGHPGVSRT